MTDAPLNAATLGTLTESAYDALEQSGDRSCAFLVPWLHVRVILERTPHHETPRKVD